MTQRWRYVRWEMAVLILIACSLVVMPADRIRWGFLMPLIPIFFRLVINWRGTTDD